MVQLLLSCGKKNVLRAAVSCAAILVCLAAPGWATKVRKQKVEEPAPPDLILEGGRKLHWERSFSSEKEMEKRPGFFTKMVNVIIGEPDHPRLVRPYSVAVDSRGRAIVTDPGANGIHIFDFEQHKYKFIERRDKDRDPMRSPQCIAVDAQDNFYVTDSEAGKIFVFDSNGKYKRAIGSLKGGEGFFKRPTGIAVDSAADRIYVTDTLRNKVFMLDMKGSVLQTIGKQGTGNVEFNVPTEVLVHEQNLFVVDAMNFRVQFLDRSGQFQTSVGQIGDYSGSMFRPKGIGLDSEGHLYVVDGLWGVVQVFDQQGRLLYYFGSRGSRNGEFQLPAGLFVAHDDRIFVVDSFNRRVQVYRYFGLPRQAAGGQP
ncbi:MAG TPA: 6-bladed beta-propeller [Candidatus Dormibacteraeota bacterium]|nr:6-bladed beta-propeller [Candidatus Dormibacteraeota bacterium]